MAQLSDDCFAFGGKLLSVDEAQALIAAHKKQTDLQIPQGDGQGGA